MPKNVPPRRHFRPGSGSNKSEYGKLKSHLRTAGSAEERGRLEQAERTATHEKFEEKSELWYWEVLRLYGRSR